MYAIINKEAVIEKGIYSGIFLEKLFLVIDLNGLSWICLDYSKVNDWRRI